MVKLAKAANKQVTQKKKAPPPPKEVEEESSEEDSSDEEEEAPPPKVVKKATSAKAAPVVKNGAAAKKADSEDEDDDDSEEESEEEAPPPKKTPAKAKATPAKAAPAKAEESDDDDDDDEDESEEEAPPPKKAAKPAAKAPVKAKPAKEASDDDDDDDDDDDEDDSEEEAPPPKKAAAKAAPAKPAAKKAAKEESDDDDDDDDDDDSEEEMDTTPAPAKAKKAGMVKAKEESEEEEEDDDDDDDDEDDDDEEEDEVPVTPAKRKAEGKKDTPPAKKAKSDGEGFCLFVGNLNANKDFEEIKEALRKFFSKNSLEVSDVRLGGSKRFGYVDFASEEDMQKALELNGKKVMGQELKLDKARSKDSSQEGKKERDARTLFVKNLPFSATADDLKEIFEDAVDVRVPLGQNGSNRGIAYIEFKTEAEADKMLEEAQGADVQGRSIMVDYVGDKSQKGAMGGGGAGAACKTLVVNNLAFSATEDALQSTFEKAVSIRIPQRDGRPKGFAFVEFESTEDAKDALENLNNTEIEGRSIRLEYSQNSGRDGGRGNSGPTKTLFVKGLSEDTTDQTLKDAFEGASAARIVTDRETGSSKGFGFVDFHSEEDCKAAKEAMEDGEIDGSKVTLDYAKPKGDGGFRGGRGGGGFGGRGGGRGGRGGFGGGFGGRGGGGRGRGGPRGGGRGRGGFGGGRGGGGFGKPQGKKIKFDD
ncbi:nucleolin [Epinephelus fuscoguttatus]|uniref:nucleolin n=1 Tax=Epinephelus fuscoguttatus TaxID=293821 RepID=UPI0020D175F1|nr:nucleolin [Epinephelus fuscoguttatus]